ncbi:MAG TPA: sigma-70 family RNA polymerase sigma factor [Chthonomonadales bacterium]|nr:sigma-70 family RNA polymerase sigma factor [Chthonomonadales bacterium]
MQSATAANPIETASVRGFENLLKEHHRKAYAFAYRLAGNREDAEDLVQDSFVRAFRARERFDASRPFDRWLFRIISNLFIDRLRARPRQLPLSLDAPMEGHDGDTLSSEIPDADADPSRILMGQAMDERLQAALNSLPPAFRQTVVLADVEGMSYEDVAEALGCAVGTVRSRLHRARTMMRDHLGGSPSRRSASLVLAAA